MHCTLSVGKLKIHRGQPHAGSSPALGTKITRQMWRKLTLSTFALPLVSAALDYIVRLLPAEQLTLVGRL